MESDLTPYTAIQSLPAHAVLVLAPHPDDEVFGCGGAVACHVRCGVAVNVVILTDGARGSGDVATRCRESRAAAQVLGYGAPEFWGLPDRGLQYTEALVQRLAVQIESANIDLVYAPSPWEVHPDHRQTALLAAEAVQRVGVPVRLAFYEVGAPLRPNVLVDITTVLPTKEAAIACFASQLAEQDYARKILALNQYRTYTLARETLAAEAFWVCSAQELARALPAGLALTVSPGMLSDVTSLPQRSPLVSILIRSMDRDLLMQALDSVALQTYPAIEVVVVAARPVHRPLPAMCGPFPLRLLATDAPLQRSAAANRAMEQARGDLLLFLDDDDWLMPGHIARLSQVLARHPQVLAAYTGICLVDASGQSTGMMFDLPFDALRQMSGNLMPIHAVLFRAEVTARGCRFDETLDLYEDWDFWQQVATLAPMVHLPGVSGVYRVHDSSHVHAEAGPMGAAAALIYQKWRTHWADWQIGQAMQRVWSYPELEIQLTNTRQYADETRNRAVVLQQQLEQAKIQTLRDQETIQDMVRNHELLAQELARHSHVLSAMRNSSSWRLTAPLRTLASQFKSSFIGKALKPAFRLRAILTSEGAQGVRYRLKQRLATRHEISSGYAKWLQVKERDRNETPDNLHRAMQSWPKMPLISIVMPVYNPPVDLLQQAVASIQAQVYPRWELCIADDASPNAQVWQLLQELSAQDHRIKVVRRAVNGHISQASNSALALAEGEFVALMDNDDLLATDALYWIAEAVNRVPAAQIIYSDEDKLDAQDQRFGPYFKPDWNYTLFLGHNLISHLGVFRTNLMRAVGGFRLELEGSQDYDLALRCVEQVEPGDIVHVQRVLYHWRAIEGSTASGNDAKPYAALAAQRALQEHRQRIGQPCSVEILPTSNYRCLRPNPSSRHSLTAILVGAVKVAPAWISDPTHGVAEVLFADANPTAINGAVASAKGDLVALVDAALTPANPDALMELARHAVETGTGIAGGTVRNRDGLLVAGGLVLNPRTVASTFQYGLPKGNTGYMGRGSLAQELSAVSLDCVVIRKEVWVTNGLMSTEYGINDIGAVAACLTLRSGGYRVVWCPGATWITREPRVQSMRRDRRRFLQNRTGKVAEWLQRDPAYHPLLNAEKADFSLQP